jgi:hypothetical protein
VLGEVLDPNDPNRIELLEDVLTQEIKFHLDDVVNNEEVIVLSDEGG